MAPRLFPAPGRGAIPGNPDHLGERMARLFSRMNAGAVDDPQYGHFVPDPAHGGFDLPDELSDRLAGFCHRGKPAWETEEQRGERLHGEDLDRRRDPAMLYDAVGE